MHDITSIKDAVLAVASLGKDGETLKRYQPSVDAYNVALTEFDAQAKRYKEETNGDLLKAATPLTDRKIALYYDVKSLGIDALADSPELMGFYSECRKAWNQVEPVDPRTKKTRAANMVDWDKAGIMQGVLLNGFTEAVKAVGKNATAVKIKAKAIELIEEKELRKLWSTFKEERQVIDASGKSKDVPTFSAKVRLGKASGQPTLWNQMLNVMVKKDLITRTNTKPTGKGAASKGASYVYNIK
tara:strand:+ start:175 stop:903 length:729 start_codon:yes stop_codon:yes gene_type:complete